MHKILHLAGLAVLAATILLGPVPVVHCRTVAACPMLDALAPPCADGHEPVASIDCCVDQSAPQAQTTGPTGFGQLDSVTARPATATGEVVPLPPRLRAMPAPVRGDDPVPLYTLHATLLT